MSDPCSSKRRCTSLMYDRRCQINKIVDSEENLPESSKNEQAGGIRARKDSQQGLAVDSDDTDDSYSDETDCEDSSHDSNGTTTIQPGPPHSPPRNGSIFHCPRAIADCLKITHITTTHLEFHIQQIRGLCWRRWKYICGEAKRADLPKRFRPFKPLPASRLRVEVIHIPAAFQPHVTYSINHMGTSIPHLMGGRRNIYIAAPNVVAFCRSIRTQRLVDIAVAFAEHLDQSVAWVLRECASAMGITVTARGGKGKGKAADSPTVMLGIVPWQMRPGEPGIAVQQERIGKRSVWWVTLKVAVEWKVSATQEYGARMKMKKTEDEMRAQARNHSGQRTGRLSLGGF